MTHFPILGSIRIFLKTFKEYSSKEYSLKQPKLPTLKYLPSSTISEKNLLNRFRPEFKNVNFGDKDAPLIPIWA